MPHWIHFNLVGKLQSGLCWTHIDVSRSRHDGAEYVADKSGTRTLLALVDTGAQISAISRSMAEKLGIVWQSEEVVQGVHGEKSCGIAVVFVGVRGKPQHRVPIAIVDMEPDMLIGMDELSRGVFIVNGPAGEWRWIDDEDPKRLATVSESLRAPKNPT